MAAFIQDIGIGSATLVPEVPVTTEDYWGTNSSFKEVDKEEEQVILDTGHVKEFHLIEERDNAVSLEELFNKAYEARERKIHTILLRTETLDLIESLSQEGIIDTRQALWSVLFQSQKHLHAFADLIQEDLITLSDGTIVLTEICERFLKTLTDE